MHHTTCGKCKKKIKSLEMLLTNAFLKSRVVCAAEIIEMISLKALKAKCLLSLLTL